MLVLPMYHGVITIMMHYSIPQFTLNSYIGVYRGKSQKYPTQSYNEYEYWLHPFHTHTHTHTQRSPPPLHHPHPLHIQDPCQWWTNCFVNFLLSFSVHYLQVFYLPTPGEVLILSSALVLAAQLFLLTEVGISCLILLKINTKMWEFGLKSELTAWTWRDKVTTVKPELKFIQKCICWASELHALQSFMPNL